MSRIIYNGQLQTLTLIGKYNFPIGTWPAAAIAPSCLPDGEYKVLDQTAPYKPEGAEFSASSEYGAFGVIRVAVSGQEDVGIHSSQQPQAGICTTELAMETITRAIRNDSLVSLRVVRNEE